MEPPKVTVEVSTKNRYDILTNCLQSIVSQTYKPYEIIVFDDSDNPKDVRNDSRFFNILRIAELKGIKWRFLYGQKRGQVFNHHAVLQMVDTPWVWRKDDDNIAEPNTLEKLVRHTFDEKVGAVASVVLHPGAYFDPKSTSPFIEDCHFKYATQFAKFDGVKEVDHLYSTFLYRVKAARKHGYESRLSKVGHREETIFSYNIKREGWKLLVDGSATTWHFQFPTGGIRDGNDGELWRHDEQIFREKLNEWGVKSNNYFPIYLDNGIGDHFCFKHLIPEIKKKYPNHKLIAGVCYPDVFFDMPEVELLGIDNMRILLSGNVDKYNVYGLCFQSNWKGTLLDAFRNIYLN